MGPISSQAPLGHRPALEAALDLGWRQKVLYHCDVRLSDQELEALIGDNVPVFDLTSHILGIADQPGSIAYITRQETVICASEEAVRLMAKLGISAEAVAPSGECLAPGMPIMIAGGPLGAIHQAWRMVGSLLGYASGIATRTRRLLQTARAVKPGLSVLTTRKFFPGSKRLSIKAVLAGGALPHRLGLSETVLIFPEHLAALGDMQALAEELAAYKNAAAGKPVAVEVNNRADALAAAAAGVDVLQVDKLTPEQAGKLVAELRERFPRLYIQLAGGINLDNVAAYAAAGADALVTSWPYYGPPADIKAFISAGAEV